jgi:hypothetical protein
MKGQFPASLRAGVTFDHCLVDNQHEAPAWALVALLRGPSSIDITSQPEGSKHRMTVAAAETAGWAPGQYAFSLRAVAGDAVIELDSGLAEILPDFAAITDGTDQRAHAQIALANIEAVLERRSTQDQDRYTINNRELWRTPLGDLLKLRDYYRAELARMRAKQRGRLFGRQLKATF